MECDLLIKGGTILDGTSNPGFKGTLAINATLLGGMVIAGSDDRVAGVARKVGRRHDSSRGE
ncbi:MAG TPA: hypothetical protein DCY61_02775 [Dehalococcoidia bacterium]|nr:hypothetical protein [Dehalococcoidia bacterium]